MVLTLPAIDLDNPPATPPENALVLAWELGRRLWAEHQPDAEGHCMAVTCRATFEPWPCNGYAVAKGGMLASVWGTENNKRLLR